jgi:hypothetical protein
MENENKILEELKSLTPSLMQIQKKQTYSVSASYFDNLAHAVVEKIRSGTEPRYYFTKQNPYITPANYFDRLPQLILDKVPSKTEENDVLKEMENVAPLLNRISKKPVFSVPEHYFENSVINSIADKQKAKVVSFYGTRLLRYTTAAVVTGLLGIGIFLFNGKNTRSNDPDLKAAADVKKLSEQEIIDFLKTNSPIDNVTSLNNNVNPTEKDIKQSVSEIPDREIQRFLKENGEQDEI